MLNSLFEELFDAVYNINKSFDSSELVNNTFAYIQLTNALKILNHKYEIYPITTIKNIKGYWKVSYFDFNISIIDLQKRFNYKGDY